MGISEECFKKESGRFNKIGEVSLFIKILRNRQNEERWLHVMVSVMNI